MSVIASWLYVASEKYESELRQKILFTITSVSSFLRYLLPLGHRNEAKTDKMNRLAVYSYLTRYPYEHTGFGRLFTAPLLDANIPVKIGQQHSLNNSRQIQPAS